MTKKIGLNIIAMFRAQFDKNNCTSHFDHRRRIYNRIPGNEKLVEIFKTLPEFDEACRQVKRKMAFPQVPVIVEAVEELYKANGESADLDENAVRSLAACIRNWMGGQNRVRRANLDDSKRCLWIDAFSALNLKYNCFSDSETDFKTFLSRYSAFISEVDNTALVGITPRSLSDICEAYCVYMGKTQSFYKDMLRKLRGAKESAEVSAAPDYGYTKLIKIDIINYFMDARVVSPEKMVNMLCDYVSQTPERFDIECYFCTMCDMLLNLIQNQFVTIDEIGTELYDLFCSLDADYETKAQNMIKLKKALFEAFIGPYNGSNTSVIYARSVLCTNRYEGLESAIYSVLTLLRFGFIVGVIAQYESINSRRAMNYRDSVDLIVRTINDSLRQMEISTLGIAENRTQGKELDEAIFVYLKKCPCFR